MAEIIGKLSEVTDIAEIDGKWSEVDNMAEVNVSEVK